MRTTTSRPAMYEGSGDRLMEQDVPDRVVLIPDASTYKTPSREAHIRIMWGQSLLGDLMEGRYRTLICAVNPDDNSHGIISQITAFAHASQWDAASITAYARHMSQAGRNVRVLKFDMDPLEVLAVLRQPGQCKLTLGGLSAAMRIIAGMLSRRTDRLPVASVSFLGARVNHLVDAAGQEPAFETVLSHMYAAGYHGDVYPSPGLWRAAPTAVFARYPFPSSLDACRNGGF